MYFSISYCEENLENTVCHHFSEDMLGRPLLILGSDGLGSYHLLCGFVRGTVLVKQKVYLHLRRVNSFEVKLHQQLKEACGLGAEVAEVTSAAFLPLSVTCTLSSNQMQMLNLFNDCCERRFSSRNKLSMTGGCMAVCVF